MNFSLSLPFDGYEGFAFVAEGRLPFVIGSFDGILIEVEFFEEVLFLFLQNFGRTLVEFALQTLPEWFQLRAVGFLEKNEA